MTVLKEKGNLAELRVAADLADRGCQISIPFGENCDYDLVADMKGVLHRVQVKYTESDGQIVLVRCRSHSLTNGKVRHTKHYTPKTVDWIAVTIGPQTVATTCRRVSWERTVAAERPCG
jgi:PD-(D/E)XK endonuclease